MQENSTQPMAATSASNGTLDRKKWVIPTLRVHYVTGLLNSVNSASLAARMDTGGFLQCSFPHPIQIDRQDL